MRTTSFLVWTPIATILLLLGIAAVTLSTLALNKADDYKWTAQGIYKEPYRDNVYDHPFDALTGWYVYYVASGVDLGSTRSILAAGAIAIATAPIVIFILAAGRREVNRPGWSRYATTSMLFAVGTTAASIVGLVYSMVKTYTSSTIFHGPFAEVTSNTTYRPDLGGPGNGTYSLDGWTCQAKDLFAVESGRDVVDEMCTLSRAARWLTIPLVVFSLLLLVLTSFAIKQPPASTNQHEKRHSSSA